jgi:hypothetical protein
MRYRHASRRSRPTGCLLGGLAGVVLVSVLWPHQVLQSDWIWLLGLLAGAVVGVLIQALVHQVLASSTRHALGTRLLARHH